MDLPDPSIGPLCNFRAGPFVVVDRALEQADRLVLRSHRVDGLKVVLGKKCRRRGNWGPVKLEKPAEDSRVLKSVKAAQANCSG